jgi:hypothetical protein
MKELKRLLCIERGIDIMSSKDFLSKNLLASLTRICVKCESFVQNDKMNILLYGVIKNSQSQF